MLTATLLRAASLLLLAPLAASQCLEWDTGIPPAGLHANGTFREAIVWDDGTGPAIYVGGEFTSIGGVPANGIAKWNGSSWSPLGQGLEGPFATCIRLFPWSIGGAPVLVVGGVFDQAGGQPAGNIAIWNGTQWSTLGAGFDDSGAVWDIELFDTGFGPELYACGGFGLSGSTSVERIARWDGVQWHPLGSGLAGAGNRAYAMAVYDEGSGPRLFVAGTFTHASGQPLGAFVRWDGASWSQVGSGLVASGFSDAVIELEVLDTGSGPRLYAGGIFVGGNFLLALASWNGASYQWFNSASGDPLSGQVLALEAFDDGTGPGLFVSGGITLPGGPPANNIAKWDGQSFSTLGSGIGGATAVYRLRALPDLAGGADDLWLLGKFTSAGGMPTQNVARWKGCDGPGVMFCPGDASSAVPCPCANTGAYDHGCRNSATSGGALLSASGTTSPDTVVLLSQGELAAAATVFLQGDAVGMPTSFGDGLRCAGGNLLRLYVKNAVNGIASAPAPSDPGLVARAAQLGDVIALGSTRVYQAYYRDPDLAFCPEASGGNAWNTSSAVRIDW